MKSLLILLACVLILPTVSAWDFYNSPTSCTANYQLTSDCKAKVKVNDNFIKINAIIDKTPYILNSDEYLITIQERYGYTIIQVGEEAEVLQLVYDYVLQPHLSLGVSQQPAMLAEPTASPGFGDAFLTMCDLAPGSGELNHLYDRAGSIQSGGSNE